MVGKDVLSALVNSSVAYTGFQLFRTGNLYGFSAQENRCAKDSFLWQRQAHHPKESLGNDRE